MVRHEQETGEKTKNLYLGTKDYSDLQKYLNDNFRIGIGCSFLSTWFNGAHIIKVDVPRHINVC